MPILSDIIQGSQSGPSLQGNQMPGGIMDILRSLQQQQPPPSQEEQMVRGKTKAIASLVSDFTGGLVSVPDEMKPTLAQSFLKNILNPKSKPQSASAESSGTQEPTIPQEPMSVEGEKGTDEERKKSVLWEVLKRAGVPGLAAILGSTGAMPLAGAAGLGTGYVKGFGEAEKMGLEREKIEQEKSATKDVVITDADGNIKNKITIGKGDQLKIGQKMTPLDAFIESIESPTSISEKSESKRSAIKAKFTGSLPNTITTTSQAKEYLIKQGMSEEDAISWIRNNG